MSDLTPEVRDLLAAVLEAIDLPHPATAGGSEVHDRLLAARAVHARIALRNLLDGPSLGPAWTAQYLRKRSAQHPVAGYVTVEQADAALDQGKTWSEAVALPAEGTDAR